jgi:FAD/FMN-containing dehydrogenase
MKGIHVDPRNRTARAQGGVTWAEPQSRDAAPRSCRHRWGGTGIAGLTLGGGLGWLMGKHGLALDNFLSVELVTAEGKVLRASKEEEPDLGPSCRGLVRHPASREAHVSSPWCRADRSWDAGAPAKPPRLRHE